MLAALMACSGQYDAEKDFRTYSSEDGKETIITGYLGNKSEVRIPPKIKKRPVTAIGESVFMEKGLVSVIIPDTVITIADTAFMGNDLGSVTIPEGVTSIGNWAFARNQLTGIAIPDSVTFIGNGAFAQNQLTSVTIPDSVATIGRWAFENNQLASIIISDNVTSIKDYAFSHNPQLTSITIGANVELSPSRESFDYHNGRNNFDTIYERRGRKAGTYIYADGRWRPERTGDALAEGEEFDDDYVEEPERVHAERYGYPVLVDYSSIYYVFASSMLSSSQGYYPSANLVDGSWRSWAEGVKGNGIGESFTIVLGKMDIAGFALKNGYGHLDHYSKNNRVKSFKIYIDGKYTETIAIRDSISFEQYAFTGPVKCETIRFEIDDVYPGTDYDDTCIAEVALLEQIGNDSIFYDTILFSIHGSFNDGYRDLYESNVQGMASISDIDRLLLGDYLPFDSLVEHGYAKKSKIALLDSPSSLQLTSNLPRLDGATAMYPLYSSFVRAVYPEIDLVEGTDDYGSHISSWSVFNWPYYPSAESLRYSYYLAENEKFGSIVQCNTTSEAYRRLIDGETDIIFCYEPSQADRSAAVEKGKSFNLVPIAKDAFVFIVNEKNVLDNISQGRIRDIYSGRVTNWKDISGVDEPIIAYQRRENSGSQTILQSIMRGDRLIQPIHEGEYVSTRMDYYIRKVTSDFYNYNSAIGYTFLFYLTQMAGTAGVKTLAVDGVAPTRQNIQNNTYPFVQTVYAITTGNENENTRKFIEWILSAQGQELVAKTGYTPIR